MDHESPLGQNIKAKHRNTTISKRCNCNGLLICLEDLPLSRGIREEKQCRTERQPLPHQTQVSSGGCHTEPIYSRSKLAQ